jgi:HAMP domain-containing protein
VRIPLYLKLMASYVLVVGFIVVPSFFYVQRIQQRELHDNLEQELRSELVAVGDRLAAMPAEQTPDVVAQLRGLLPHRATLIAPDGRVLADSESSGPFDNHSDRAEIKEALTSVDGFGTAMRRSTTTGDEYVYTARRFPTTGAPRGVIRLAVSTGAIRATESKASSFLNRTCAAALSAAVVLSFIAAMVLSRPLKRIAEGARAFAQGDFGHAIDVHSNDELGDVVHALDDLAAKLRDRLLSAGADRATLQGLLDELPLGVIVYTPDREPSLVSARARAICDFDPAHETERARAIIVAREHADLVSKVLEDGVGRDAVVTLSEGGRKLKARWIALYAADGRRQPGLAISHTDDHEAQAHRALVKATAMLRSAATSVADPAVALPLLEAWDEAATACAISTPDPQQVEAVTMGSLCARAKTELDALSRVTSVHLELDVADSDVAVAEADDRSHHAVRSLLAAALRGASRGSTVRARAESVAGRARVSVAQRLNADAIFVAARPIREMGGDAGGSAEGESAEAWVLLPRA